MRFRAAVTALLPTLFAGACVGTGDRETVADDSTEAVTPEPETRRKGPMLVMSTTVGDITIELFPEEAPVTVENILEYVDAGFYDGTIFHRVVPGFVVQGGGFSPSMDQKPTRPPITNEADNGLKNERGTLSMARLPDINSATSQFFINVVDNANLDHNPRSFGYAVFGRVVEGMDVVDTIVARPRGTVGRYSDVPLEPVIIRSVRRQQ